MKRLERILAALTPKRWPVRWRLAAVSAALTLVILIIFAVVVGRLATNRLQSNFDDELRDNAAGSRSRSSSRTTRSTVGSDASFDLDEMALAEDAAIQLVDPNGGLRRRAARRAPARAAASRASRFADVGSLRVATTPALAVRRIRPVRPQHRQPRGDDQPALAVPGRRRPRRHAAGRAGRDRVAGRAMRPVSTLTATAREIASTRDPSLRIPEPETDDEVGELARTLEQMLRELDAARSETEQMMQAQREFVADASHELRTPLTSILANLELLQERLDATGRRGEEGEMVESALRSSRRMSRLVSDLLLLARADAGRTGARRECDLAAVAAAALAEVRPVAERPSPDLGRPRSGAGGRATPTSFTGWPSTCSTTACGTPPPAPRSGSRSSAATATRCSRSPTTAPGSRRAWRGRCSPGSFAATGPADVAGDGGAGLGLAIVKAVAISHGGDVEAGSSPRRGGALHGAVAAAEVFVSRL